MRATTPPRRLVPRVLHRAGLRSTHLHTTSLGVVGLCISLWLRAKTVDQDERGNAERRALFVGLWTPTLWLVGDALERHER
jgi:hypothetical protein